MSFLMNFGVVFVLFGGLGDRFYDFSGLENRLENRGNFGDVTDPVPGIWQGGSTSDSDPQNS